MSARVGVNGTILRFVSVRAGFVSCHAVSCHPCLALLPTAARPDTHDTKPLDTKENPAQTDRTARWSRLPRHEPTRTDAEHP